MSYYGIELFLFNMEYAHAHKENHFEIDVKSF